MFRNKLKGVYEKDVMWLSKNTWFGFISIYVIKLRDGRKIRLIGRHGRDIWRMMSE